MKKGDIIINPYALKNFYGRLNPTYAVIYVKRDTIDGIIDCIDYEGKKRKFYVSKAEETPLTCFAILSLYCVILSSSPM